MSGKYTILAGAGISLDAPSKFPIASNIMNAIIDGISPSKEIADCLKKLKVRVDGSYTGLDAEYHLTGDSIRFEMLIDVISQFDPNLNVLDAIRNYTTPNLNHYNLAELAIRGNYVVTPNFDDLIERAIINLGYNPVTICTDADFSSYVLKPRKNNSSAVPVFKLHGSFYKYIGNKYEKYIVKETLQASLTSILSNNNELSLSTPKQRLLCDVIKTSTLIIAGYSGSDDFDIIPVLKKMVPYNLIWIEHNNDNDNKNRIEEEIDLMLKTQKNGKEQLISKSYICDRSTVTLYKTHTGTYLKALGGINSTPTENTKELNMPSFEEHIREWSLSFSEEQKYLLVGNLYHRMSLIKEAIELYKTIPSNSIYYPDSLINICSDLAQLTKFKEALDLAEWVLNNDLIKDEYNYIKLLEKIAYCKSNITDLIQSEQNDIDELFTKVIRLSVERGYNIILRDAYNDYGIYLRTYKDTTLAMSFYKKGLSLSIKLGDLRHQGFIMNNMATLLYDMGNFVKAEELALKAYHNGDLIGDFRNHGVLENLLANLYLMKGDLNKALKFCNQSIVRDKQLGNDIDSDVNFLLKGQILFEQGNLEMAEMCFNKADRLFKIASSKDYLYELRFMQLVLEICKYQHGLSTLTCIRNRQSNIKNICGSPSESTINEIAQNVARYFLDENTNIISFRELLTKLYNLKEVSNYIHIIYYMCSLGISFESIGEKHFDRAKKHCTQLSNNLRLKTLENYPVC